ncbi:MAG: twin-arginine translocation signal domain-containing protein [Armatimonadota bacterium]|nr:twin-arginine translocation signal domain-containing protein [Armatimonadota bacterium]
MGISRRKFMKTIGAAGAAAFVGGPGFLLSNTESYADAAVPVQGDSPFELIDSQILSVNDGSYADSPVIASDGSGSAWVVWLSRLKEDREMVLVSDYQGKWSIPAPITKTAGQYESPRIACAPGGAPMVVWIKIDGDKWLLESSLYKDGRFDQVKAINLDIGKPSNISLIAGKNGAFWLTWESYQEGKFRICLKQYKNGAWGRTVDITDGKTNAYDPAIALDQSGTAWVAYSAAVGGERSVYLTSYDPPKNSIGAVIDIAVGGMPVGRPNLNIQPSVWCDNEGRIWVAYQHLSPSAQVGLGYRGQMQCSAVCYQNGELRQAFPTSASHNGRTVMTGENDQYPVFAQDGSGRPWIFSRSWVTERRSWNVKASRLDGAAGWTEPPVGRSLPYC